MIPTISQIPSPSLSKAIENLENLQASPAFPAQNLIKTMPRRFPRMTKIIATLGPSTESGEVLRKLLESGVSVFRLNMSRVDYATASKLIYAVRSISTELNRPVALLLDTQGPPVPTDSSAMLNLPDTKMNFAMTKKDWEDIRFGLENSVDWIAIPPARDLADMHQLREFLATQKKSNINIIAKIEDQSALPHLDAIIREADCIMVSRRDIDVESPYEEMPLIQRRIVKKCVIAGKPVIIGAHLLESMIQNPLPTRAELTDVANAIYEQADAIMLSDETGVGR